MKRFLAACGWGATEPSLLSADASFRTYYRLAEQGRRAVLMDAPPPLEDVGSYLAVARILRTLGLSAPRVMAEDAETGFLLIEDFGDDTYTRLIARGADERALYETAVDALIALQQAVARKGLPDLPLYDEEKLLFEASLLADWYVPAVKGAPLEEAERASFLAAWSGVLRPFAAAAGKEARLTLVLRDYHVDNLVYLRERKGVRRCGLLDFQDAVLGPSSYDLVSLLGDARRDVPPALKAAMIERYLAAFPGLDKSAFLREAAILAGQRNAKIIGIFTRLWKRDGKPQYLSHIARVWRLLEEDLAHPALAPAAEWFERHLPQKARRIPEHGGAQ